VLVSGHSLRALEDVLAAIGTGPTAAR